MLLRRDRALLALDIALDIAFHAGRGSEVTGAADIAERLNAARRGIEPLLQALVRSVLLDSVRGPRGGYRMARAPREVKLAEIIAAVTEDETADVPPGKLAVVGWGSTFGPINRAVSNMIARGYSVSHIHIRHIWPLPRNLETLLKSFDKVLVAEMNKGQMMTLIKSQYLIDAKGLLKVTGQPLKIAEVEAAIKKQLDA